MGQAYENFASFCRLGYPDYEVLFGVRDADDPAIVLIQRLQREFPEVRIRLVMAQRIGPNPKVSTLVFLAEEARGQVLVISDADVRVEHDYLQHMVSPLSDPAVGVVTCPYRGEVAAGDWVARLAALHMNAAFLPSAVLANTLLGVRLGLGASIAFRAADLERIGGFRPLLEYLAEDYQAASRIADLGHASCCPGTSRTCRLEAMPFAEQWDREIRWAQGHSGDIATIPGAAGHVSHSAGAGDGDRARAV